MEQNSENMNMSTNKKCSVQKCFYREFSTEQLQVSKRSQYFPAKFKSLNTIADMLKFLSKVS